ncbi:MAG: MAPEG family protein [Betaproteobacteria bacterium]|nr:MAPEG family protein [Betaproteobacteria bacterium]
MTRLLSLVVYMAALTWLLLLAASLIRAKAWTLPGTKIAMGNRDHLPAAGPFAGRADRTARNTLESFVLFAALALVAHVSGIQSPRVLLGAEIFFWSRLVYIPVYYLGIAYLRTAVWTVGFIGLTMIASALVSLA